MLDIIYVSRLSLDFFFQKGIPAEFCSVMNNVSDDKILGNETLEMLIDEIWEKTQPRILRFLVLPYMLYFCLFISYISFLFDPSEEATVWSWLFLSPCMLYSLLQLGFEASQVVREGKQYFSSVGFIWNLLDLTSAIAVIIFSIYDLTNQLSDQSTYVIGGLAVFCLWLKLFYFMRMFNSTAAFVRMIIEMLLDIRVFLFVFFVGILAFANTFYVLDQFTKRQNMSLGENDKISAISGESYAQSIIYVYLQSLGELGFDGYNSSFAPVIYWSLFFMSSIFLQITLLNLLIAIMGDTFDRVLEVSREAKTKEICSILSEYYFLIPEEKIVKNSCFFTASLESRDSIDSSVGAGWEGKLGALKAYFGKEIEKI